MLGWRFAQKIPSNNRERSKELVPGFDQHILALPSCYCWWSRNCYDAIFPNPFFVGSSLEAPNCQTANTGQVAVIQWDGWIGGLNVAIADVFLFQSWPSFRWVNSKVQKDHLKIKILTISWSIFASSSLTPEQPLWIWWGFVHVTHQEFNL